MITRRDFLRHSGAIAGSAAGVTTSTIAAGDHREGNWRAKPDNVTIEYDEEFLRTYQPRLVTTYSTRQEFIGFFGYTVRGKPYEYDVACYWAELTHQDGLTLFNFVFGPDSHLGDHEPVYVFVDKSTGEVEKVIYSTYHHFPGEITPETGVFVQDRHQDLATHPILRVVPEWHNYSAAVGDRTGTFFTLESWIAVRDSWKENGFYQETADEAIEDPATMQTRDAWWQKNTMDYKFGPLFARLGLRGAEQSDEIRNSLS